MTEPDFSGYSLALIKEGKIIYSSKKSGIRPIAECALKYRGKIKGCILHDKIIGLGAARIIACSGMFEGIYTKVCSIPAAELLKENNIRLEAEKFAKNILNMEKTGICPMEEKALKIKDNEKFFLEVIKILKLSP